jgi:hypothetical protein
VVVIESHVTPMIDRPAATPSRCPFVPLTTRVMNRHRWIEDDDREREERDRVALSERARTAEEAREATDGRG